MPGHLFASVHVLLMQFRFFLFFVAVALLVSVAGASDVECHFTSQRVQCGDRTCKNNKCVRCINDADCYEGGMRCDLKAGGLCRLKSLHDNLTPSAVLAAFLSVAVCCVGIVAGVGGGGVLVPLFSVLMSLPVSFAVVVSQLTIVGQSVFSFSYIVDRLHDVDASRPLVNYQYLSLLMPMAIAGTSVGVQLGRVLPDIARILLLIFTFVVLLRRLVGKAVEQFQAAQRMLRAPVVAIGAPSAADDEDYESDGEESCAEHSALHANNSPSAGVVMPSLHQSATLPQTNQACASRAVESDPPAQSPLGSLRTEIIIVISSVTFLLVGAVARQMATCGTLLYSILSVGPLIVLLGIFYFAYWRLQQRLHNIPSVSDEEPALLHFAWNTHTSLMFPIIAIGAGAAASMLGIGGGLILGFLLFEAGLTPQESSATSSVATLLMAGESVIQLSLAGNVQLDYAIAFLAVGAFSGFVGQKLIMPTIKERGWHFLIIGALTLIVALSMICLVSLAVYQAAVGLRESGGSLFAWGSLCKRRYVEDTVHG